MKEFLRLDDSSLEKAKVLVERQHKTGRCLVSMIICNVCQTSDVGVFDSIEDFIMAFDMWVSRCPCNSYFTMNWRSIGFKKIEVESILFSLEKRKGFTCESSNTERACGNFH